MWSLFNFRPVYIVFIFAVRTKERTNQWWNVVVILQVKHPIVRQWNYWAHHHLQTTRNITIKRLIPRILYPLINRQLHILATTRTFIYHLIACRILLLGPIMTKMSMILPLITIDTPNILINHWSIISLHFLRMRLRILIQIYLIGKDSIQPLRITLKLYDQMIGRMNICVVLHYLLLTPFT